MHLLDKVKVALLFLEQAYLWLYRFHVCFEMLLQGRLWVANLHCKVPTNGLLLEEGLLGLLDVLDDFALTLQLLP